jgi:hypothetical protein
VQKIIQPNQTVNNWHISNNISAPQTLINLPIASLKSCSLASSFENHKPIFEDKKNMTLRGADKIPAPFPHGQKHFFQIFDE